MIISRIRKSDNPAGTSLRYSVYIVFFVIACCFGLLKYWGIVQNFILFMGLAVGLAIAQIVLLAEVRNRKTTYQAFEDYAFTCVDSKGNVITSSKSTYRKHLVEDILINFVITFLAMGVMLFVAWLIKSTLAYFGYY